jgi:hypothetical protein
MNADHPAEHGELLIAVLSGERAPEAPEFRRLLAACPECRARWERMHATAARLREAGAKERRELAAALADEAAPGEERIASTLSGLVRAEPWTKPRPPRRWLWLAVAAGLVLAGGLAWRSLRKESTQPPVEDVPLGGSELRLIEPVGEVDAFGPFRWEYDGRADARFDLFLYAEAESGERELLLEIPRRKETQWTLDPAQRALLPRRIRWEVNAVDEAGEVVGSDAQSAWLR